VVLVVGSGALVRADVPRALRRLRASGCSLAPAALVEAFLVTARVLAGVGQTVDTASTRPSLDTQQVPVTGLN